MKYEESDLVGLTDEERAALLEDDEQEGDEEEGADGADTGHDEGDDDGEEGADGDGQDDAGDAGEGDEPGDDGADDGDEGGEPEPERSQQQGPILVAEAPEKAEERLGEIKTAKADLRKKYDDGELTFDEYESQVEALDDERMEIRLALKEAETAAKIEHQRQVNEREAQINGFLAEIGVKRDFSDLRFAALDNAVKIIANQEDNANLGVREILEKAYGLCVEQGVIQKKADKAPEVQAKPRKPIATVPNLAKVPAADQTDTDDGNRFAYIDRIADPVAREKAFQKLSPADQEAYLST